MQPAWTRIQSVLQVVILAVLYATRKLQPLLSFSFLKVIYTVMTFEYMNLGCFVLMHRLLRVNVISNYGNLTELILDLYAWYFVRWLDVNTIRIRSSLI